MSRFSNCKSWIFLLFKKTKFLYELVCSSLTHSCSYSLTQSVWTVLFFVLSISLFIKYLILYSFTLKIGFWRWKLVLYGKSPFLYFSICVVSVHLSIFLFFLFVNNFTPMDSLSLFCITYFFHFGKRKYFWKCHLSFEKTKWYPAFWCGAYTDKNIMVLISDGKPEYGVHF